MFERFLSEQNLHWFGRKLETGTRRELLDRIMAEMTVDHIIAVSGLRRCGKSFLMKQIIRELIDQGITAGNILFINLEQALFTGMDTGQILDRLMDEYRQLRNPKGRVYVFLDEIQTLQGWEIWLKYRYDLRQKIKFFITGSNSRLLSSEFATRLTGRVIEHGLTPFNFREYLAFREFELGEPEEWILKKEAILYHFEQYLRQGGMPEVVGAPSQDVARTLLTSTFDSMIYKDIVPRFNVRQAETLRKLGLYLIGQAGNISNLKKIGVILEMDRNTVRDFQGYLETSLMIHVLNKFDFSEKRQLLSQKKTYVCDNGFITGLTFQFSPDRGDLLENLVQSQLGRAHQRIYYYKNRSECDFIVYDFKREAAAYQVCYELTEHNKNREIRGLVAGCKIINLNEGIIFTWDQTEEFEHSGVRVHVKPVWKWMLAPSAIPSNNPESLG